MQGPEIYLKAIGVTVKCMMESEQDAILDMEHRTSIGYETYFFSSEAAKHAFDSDIARHCGILTDPVTKRRFRPTSAPHRTLYRERLYIFPADSCKISFDMMPEMYALPSHTMLPKVAGTRSSG